MAHSNPHCETMSPCIVVICYRIYEPYEKCASPQKMPSCLAVICEGVYEVWDIIATPTTMPSCYALIDMLGGL